MREKTLVKVAVGVLVNASNEVLVARRHAHLHQGGLLEFPGGKLEDGEDRFAGLQREFQEELGVQVKAAFPLRQIIHHYEDKSVLLDIWSITDYSGEPRGLEGQPIYWLPISELKAQDFPAANKAIVDDLALPDRLAITPDCDTWPELKSCLDAYIEQGITLIQLRQKNISAEEYNFWHGETRRFCAENGVKVMYSHFRLPDLTAESLDGIHCDSRALSQLRRRPISREQLFGASCHCLEELKLAESLGADYATLSPVQATKNYESEQLLGWPGFAELRGQVSLPVFALGGLSGNDMQHARRAGAQGLAGIRLFLSGK